MLKAGLRSGALDASGRLHVEMIKGFFHMQVWRERGQGRAGVWVCGAGVGFGAEERMDGEVRAVEPTLLPSVRSPDGSFPCILAKGGG